MKLRWPLIACLALMSSCGKYIPGDIIQPRKMEKVLYDYHLSMGMSNNSKNTEREAQKKYIFQKHGITEAEFDSSMVWYTRESSDLLTIYSNLDKRFKREYAHIGRLLESRDESNTRYQCLVIQWIFGERGISIGFPRLHSCVNLHLKSMQIPLFMKEMHFFGIWIITS